jgi:hypothetical protein
MFFIEKIFPGFAAACKALIQQKLNLWWVSLERKGNMPQFP